MRLAGGEELRYDRLLIATDARRTLPDRRPRERRRAAHPPTRGAVLAGIGVCSATEWLAGSPLQGRGGAVDAGARSALDDVLAAGEAARGLAVTVAGRAPPRPAGAAPNPDLPQERNPA